MNLLKKMVSMFHLNSFDVNLSPNSEAAKLLAWFVFLIPSFVESTSNVMKKEIFKKIRECVDVSVKTRNDPIPGSSLLFGKPTDRDTEEYRLVTQALQVE